MSREVTFKITVPHAAELDFHQWYYPGGWRGIGPTEQRDRAGRRSEKRDLHLPPWFVLACNNTECPGRAVVPVSMLTDYADSQDRAVSS